MASGTRVADGLCPGDRDRHARNLDSGRRRPEECDILCMCYSDGYIVGVSSLDSLERTSAAAGGSVPH